jgi:hypothetical protein
MAPPRAMTTMSFPYLQWEDNICLAYAVNRFKDPFAAWMLRKSGWPSRKDYRIPITQFLGTIRMFSHAIRLIRTMPNFPAIIYFVESAI